MDGNLDGIEIFQAALKVVNFQISSKLNCSIYQNFNLIFIKINF